VRRSSQLTWRTRALATTTRTRCLAFASAAAACAELCDRSSMSRNGPHPRTSGSPNGSTGAISVIGNARFDPRREASVNKEGPEMRSQSSGRGDSDESAGPPGSASAGHRQDTQRSASRAASSETAYRVAAFRTGHVSALNPATGERGARRGQGRVTRTPRCCAELPDRYSNERLDGREPGVRDGR
jgi:hypothetical protein